MAASSASQSSAAAPSSATSPATAQRAQTGAAPAPAPAPAKTTAPPPGSISGANPMPNPAQNPWGVHLSYAKNSQGIVTTISYLNWNSSRSKLQMTDDNEPLVVLYGNYGRRDRSSLVCSGRRVEIEPGGNFRVAFHPQKARESLKLVSIGTRGEIEQEILVVDLPGLPALLKQASTPQSAPSLTVGAGFTHLSYSETTIPQFTENAITAKLSFVHAFKPGSPWDIGLSGYATVVSLSTTSAAKQSIDFLGGNARVGYRLPILPEPWRLSLMLGLYLTTTSSSDGTFGFTNLMGPEFYPVLRRRLSGGGMIAGYFKYSPVGSGLSLSFGSREIAGGLSYTPRTNASFPISFTLDIADLSASIEGTEFQSTSATLGLAIGF